MNPSVLCIVIPTLNESARISRCLQSLARLQRRGAQIVVCDGGSNDDTREIARQYGVQVIHCARGRARQMNAGADACCARMLAFVHADTQLNDAVLDRLWALTSDRPEGIWGRFDVRLSGPGAAFRVIEACMNVRSRITGIATGDQLIFCSSDLFRAVNGFAEIDLMEDIQFSSKLRRLRWPVCCRERVRTSSRKWRENGIMRTVLLMWRLRLAYALGANPARLAKLYERKPMRSAVSQDSR